MRLAALRALHGHHPPHPEARVFAAALKRDQAADLVFLPLPNGGVKLLLAAHVPVGNEPRRLAEQLVGLAQGEIGKRVKLAQGLAVGRALVGRVGQVVVAAEGKLGGLQLNGHREAFGAFHGEGQRLGLGRGPQVQGLPVVVKPLAILVGHAPQKTVAALAVLHGILHRTRVLRGQRAGSNDVFAVGLQHFAENRLQVLFQKGPPLRPVLQQVRGAVAAEHEAVGKIARVG